MKQQMELFAVVPPGLEMLCAAEAAALGLPAVRPEVGGVSFSGGLRELYLANLWLRSASRVLVRLATVRASDFPALFRKCVRLPWGSFVRPGSAVQLRASSRSSRLVHTGRIVETVSAAIERALGMPLAAGTADSPLLLVRFENDLCQVSVDSSGALLHRRGYRSLVGPAPLRENLAAALLLALEWQGTESLCDPCCGSGTIPIEAALLAANRAPGAGRGFAFMHWPGFRSGLWQMLLGEAERQVRPIHVRIAGADADADVLALARSNAEQAGVAANLELAVQRLEDQPPGAAGGLLLCNPPYGIRLDAASDPRQFFRDFGTVCRRSFAGWRVALLVPEERMARATGLPLHKLLQFENGGLPVGLYVTRR